MIIVVDANPNDPWRAGTGKKTNAERAQRQRWHASTSRTNRVLQVRDAAGCDVAKKPERQMELFRLRPANRTVRREGLQFILNTNHFLPNRIRHWNRHKETKPFD